MLGAAALALLMCGTAACGSSAPFAGSGGPGPGADAAGPPPTPEALAAFLGNGLSWTDGGSFGLDRAEMLTDPSAPGGRTLRIRYPRGSASPAVGRDQGAPTGGAQAYLRLAHPADTVTLRYQVRFPPGFDFVKGGKLPGLFGGTAGSGGQHHLDGFSTRYMWRTAGAGEVYAYLPREQGYGDSLGRGSWRFVPGGWHLITQRVRLNAPGGTDGSITVWLDGDQVFDRSDLVFRTTPLVHVDGLFLCTFFGGGDGSWASPRDQYADFSGFELSDRPDGH